MSDPEFGWQTYPPEGLQTTENALFEAWDSLENFRSDLVVVGGLAVHYQSRDQLSPVYFGAPTLDVDFGISLGTDAGMKGTVQFDLLQAGYESLGKLKTEKLVLAWRTKRTTRAAVRVEIEKMLDSGLPEKYTTELFETKCGVLFQHVLEKYPESGESVYEAVG